MAIQTFQTGIHASGVSGTITDYALFLGGLNVTRGALQQYDPLKTGFGRIFMIRTPQFIDDLAADNTELGRKRDMFKHILEYANTGVEGGNDISVQTAQMQGGYTNRAFDIPTIATDDTNELTIKTYEFSGSPVREFIQFWINGVTDLQSGFSHYYGAKTAVSQANHTAEFIYVVTDQSGKKVEFAALYANCFPKNVQLSQFNYDAGTHDLVTMNVTFTATRYMSPQINKQAVQLLSKYNVLVDSLYFNSGYEVDPSTNGTYYNGDTGKLTAKTKQHLDYYDADRGGAQYNLDAEQDSLNI